MIGYGRSYLQLYVAICTPHLDNILLAKIV